MVRSPPTGPCYGAYHDRGGWQLFLQCHAQIYFSPQLSTEADCRHGYNMPSRALTMVGISCIKILQTTRQQHSSTYKDQRCYFLNSLQLLISWLELSLKMLVLRVPLPTMVILFAIPRRIFQVEDTQCPWLKFGIMLVALQVGWSTHYWSRKWSAESAALWHWAGFFCCLWSNWQ